MGTDWTEDEVKAIVDDHFEMLTMQLAGQAYSKSNHRRALQGKLLQRTDASIELKHRNISAVLLELGCPFITGYKPLPHYQNLLFDTVLKRLEKDSVFDLAALAAVEAPAVPNVPDDFGGILQSAPARAVRARDSGAGYFSAREAGCKRDYLAREARNSALGSAGEEFVLAYESRKLWAAGKKSLSDRVERVSQTRGDGLGYDIKSYEIDGQERLIEVKTTTFGKETPFFVTPHELACSAHYKDVYHLSRVYDFRRGARLFELAGAVASHVFLDPASYIARFY